MKPDMKPASIFKKKMKENISRLSKMFTSEDYSMKQ